MITIRRASAMDAAAISRVRAEGWRSAYRGIVPDDYLDSMDVDSWAKRLEQTMEGSPNSSVLHVAEVNSEIAGWSWGGPNRDAPHEFSGELYAIYLLPEFQRRGLGLRLTIAAVEWLLDSDLHSMIVWVLAENWPARVFYERLGGSYVLERREHLGGIQLTEASYGWKDLNLITSRAG